MLLSRRALLKAAGVTAVAGLAVGVALRQRTRGRGWHAWLHIAPDGRITLHCPRMEMGQGILSSAALLVCEELDAAWESMSAAHAPLDQQFGTLHTEDSTSIRTQWLELRRLGAVARRQLVRAAAARWQVDVSACRTAAGVVSHPASGRSAAYGELAAPAAELEVAADAPLKTPAEFRLIGKGARRLDAAEMVDGSRRYTADVTLPGMLAATVRHSPRPGARVLRVDETAARAMRGFRATVDLGDAVAVVAADTWSAFQAARALRVEWQGPATPALDTPEMRKLLIEACGKPAQPFFASGDDTLPATEQHPETRDYSIPFEAHAPMETACCVADVRADACEVWAPSQSPWLVYRTAAELGLGGGARLLERARRKWSGRADGRVKVHAMPMGGSFGRRLEPDVVREAVLTSKAVGAPVKLTWTRESEFARDLFRPASQHRLRAALDGKGRLTHWRHRIAGTGILDHGAGFPYDCDNVRIEISQHELGLATGSWRSTGHTPNAFARECFMDELAERAGRDPVEFRLAHLERNPRLRKVLELAADSAGWSAAPPPGVARGAAVHPSKDSYVAQVAEVTSRPDGIAVLRIVCAVDCGLAVNPDGVRAQIEGAIQFGLGSALRGQITVKEGNIVESNFDSYGTLGIARNARIEVHLLPSAEAPGGIGEPGVPPVAPAVVNALYALEGRRRRELPLAV
jgi:isoquinoline 1-oxidoreductase subunit beta